MLRVNASAQGGEDEDAVDRGDVERRPSRAASINVPGKPQQEL